MKITNKNPSGGAIFAPHPDKKRAANGETVVVRPGESCDLDDAAASRLIDEGKAIPYVKEASGA